MLEQEQEIRVEDIVGVFKRRWLFVVLITIFSAAITAVISLYLPKTYESYALLKIGFEGPQPLESISSLNEIMKSFTMREAIARELKIENDEDFIDSLGKAITYGDVSGMLKITTLADDPQKAAKYAETVMNIIYKRHLDLYDSSQKRMKLLVKEVREAIQPVPLSAGISEFRNQPTTIEITPRVYNKPTGPIKRKIVSSAFTIALTVSIILSLFLEMMKIINREKK